jgi:exodeoxyribonuclease VII large subunit
MAAFEILKQKLAVEGLFNDEFKKPIPVYSKKIGIVSAIDGAALRDMISVAKRRFPLVELVITPASVQGNKAAESVAHCIRLLNQQRDIDLIIIARGGGTIEDLWAFNEEIVAREIFNSRIPIITGIGHEIDFTIADFVADLRAPTPSAAMELATPNRDDLFAFINDFSYNSTQNIIALCKNNKGKVLSTLSSYGFRIPFELIRRLSQQTDGLLNKLLQNIDRNLLVKNNKVSLLTRTVESHDLQKTLRKGFVLVHQDSKLIPRAKNFNPEKDFSLKFFDKEVELKSKINKQIKKI